jgi:hypothetical protein
MGMPSLNLVIAGLVVVGVVALFAKRPPHSPARAANA